MICSAWRIWKRFRWKNLVRVWAVFMAIALVLLAQTLGIHYGATKFTLKYMARNEAIPAQNAIMGQRATNLMLVDSSQDGVDEAETMMKQVLLDMKVPTATVDLAKTDPDDIPSLNRYRTVLIVMPELDSLGDELVSIMRWVEGGGNMMLAMTPEKNRLSGRDQASNRHRILRIRLRDDQRHQACQGLYAGWRAHLHVQWPVQIVVESEPQ